MQLPLAEGEASVLGGICGFFHLDAVTHNADCNRLGRRRMIPGCKASLPDLCTSDIETRAAIRRSDTGSISEEFPAAADF